MLVISQALQPGDTTLPAVPRSNSPSRRWRRTYIPQHMRKLPPPDEVDLDADEANWPATPGQVGMTAPFDMAYGFSSEEVDTQIKELDNKIFILQRQKEAIMESLMGKSEVSH